MSFLYHVDMNLRQLRTFQTVAQQGSFTQAAHRLGYAQSSITTQIQVLEESLNVKLFDRLGKSITLTHAGRELLIYADQLLTLSDEAQNKFADTENPNGKLMIGTPETLAAYRLPPLLREFRQRFPQLQLTFYPSHWTSVIGDIHAGRVDVAFILAKHYPPDATIEMNILAEEQLLLVASPEHYLAYKPQVSAEDLAIVSLILTEDGCSYRTQFEQCLAQQGIYLQEAMTFHSVEAIKQCVMAGIGVSVLPEIAVRQELATEQLIAIEWGQSLCTYTQLLWHRDKWLSPALSSLIEMSQTIIGNS